jgi:hypothetical protein
VPVQAMSGNKRQREAQEAVRAHLEQDAARITEPAVGASTCASGSQVWNGNIGTLTAKAAKKRQEQPEAPSNSCGVHGEHGVVG